MPQALTANRLIDGVVLYWKDGGWVEPFADAELFADTKTAEAALIAAKAFVAANAVVNPYLFEVKDGKPVKEREIIRAAGPSVRADLGKQADGHAFPFALVRPVSPPAAERDDDVSI
jgi:hypothetical protein